MTTQQPQKSIFFPVYITHTYLYMNSRDSLVNVSKKSVKSIHRVHSESKLTNERMQFSGIKEKRLIVAPPPSNTYSEIATE